MNLAEYPYILSILLGIIEGLTEFLPISSTAHLRIVKPWAGVALDDPYWKMYDVVIQLGAILAVVVYFWRRIARFAASFPRGRNGNRGVLNHPLSLVMLSFIVTAGPAFLLSRVISENLESLLVIGLALLIGGIAMWLIDHFLGEPRGIEKPSEPESTLPQVRSSGFRGRTRSMEEMSWVQAVWIGAVQILSAVFPGVSRSMSTIAAGQIAGLNRATALEFSFFVSMPIMLAAGCLKLYEAISDGQISPDYLGGRDTQIGVLATGFIVSFLVAWAVIAWFMAWVRRHGFVPFAIYRILLGGAVVIWALQ